MRILLKPISHRRFSQITGRISKTESRIPKKRGSNFKNRGSNLNNRGWNFKNRGSDFKNRGSDFKNRGSDFKNRWSDFNTLWWVVNLDHSYSDFNFTKIHSNPTFCSINGINYTRVITTNVKKDTWNYHVYYRPIGLQVND